MSWEYRLYQTFAGLNQLLYAITRGYICGVEYYALSDLEKKQLGPVASAGKKYTIGTLLMSNRQKRGPILASLSLE